jgi:hypothetical protein
MLCWFVVFTLSCLFLLPLIRFNNAEPLLRIFQTSVVPVGTAHRRRSSVFAHVNLQHPFQLILRLHTAPTITFPYVADALQPLHDASLLTTFCPNASVTTPALVAVVSSSANGAEMVPVEDFTAVVGPRFVYRDADISALENDAEWEKLDPEVTPVAAGVLVDATGWNGQGALSSEQRARIEKHVERAHSKHLKLRYEGLPQCVVVPLSSLPSFPDLLPSTDSPSTFVRTSKRRSPPSTSTTSDLLVLFVAFSHPAFLPPCPNYPPSPFTYFRLSLLLYFSPLFSQGNTPLVVVVLLVYFTSFLSQVFLSNSKHESCSHRQRRNERDSEKERKCPFWQGGKRRKRKTTKKTNTLKRRSRKKNRDCSPSSPSSLLKHYSYPSGTSSSIGSGRPISSSSSSSPV